MAWDWIDDVAVESIGCFGVTPEEPSDPLRVQLWTMAGAVVLGAAGALAALLLFPPIPPAGFLDLSLDAMTRSRMIGLLGGTVGGLLVGGTVGRMLGRRSFD